MKTLIEFFLSRSLFVNLLTMLTIGAGLYVVFSMNREVMPAIDFDIVSVSTIFPGASPHDVEKLVTIPIEESLQAVDGIKEFQSGSLENVSGIIITLDPDVPDKRKVLDDIEAAVEQTEDLPDGAERPRVREFSTSTQSAIEVSLARVRKDGAYLIDELTLRKQARLLENELTDLAGVARVDRRGWREKEIRVDIDPDRLFGYYLSTAQIVDILRSRNLNSPGGEIRYNDQEYIVRTVGELKSATEIAHVFVRSNDTGQFVQIKNIARVQEVLQEGEFVEKTGGHEAITLVVRKQQKADTLDMVTEVKGIVEDYRKRAPAGIQVSYLRDRSVPIERRLGVLLSNGAGGMLLVVACLFVFMGWRTSVMVALGIPVSFGITFIVLWYYGVTINLITMLGLVIVVGIIVDDAIIVSENFYRHIEQGVDAFTAALRGTLEVAAPVTATIATSIAAFAPLLFMTGIFGKFVYYVPYVIIVALLASLFECFLILPSHLHDMNRLNNSAGKSNRERGWFIKFRDRAYLPALRWGLSHKKFMLPAFVLLLAASVALQYWYGRFKLFPGSSDNFRVNITAPKGSTKETTERFTRAVESYFQTIGADELVNFTTRVGSMSTGRSDSGSRRGNNYAQIRVDLAPEIDRSRNTNDIIRELRKKTEWLLSEEALQKRRKQEERRRRGSKKDGAKKNDEAAQSTPEVPPKEVPIEEVPAQFADLRGRLVALDYERRQGGPPVGKAISIEFTGDGYDQLLSLTGDFRKMLSKMEGVKDVDDDYDEGKTEIRIRINERLASQAGVSVARAAQAVNTAFQGTVATSMRREGEDLDIRVQFAERYRNNLNALSKVFVPNSSGHLVPISRLVVREEAQGVTVLTHMDGKRLITLTANTDEDILTSRQANALIQEKSAELLKPYPGYRLRFGGEASDTEESLGSLQRAFAFALFLIFMVLASLFRSLMQPLVVLAAVPFAMIGVILAFLAHGMPLSFLALMGAIGLAGIVVNDSIVLVDFANRIRETEPELNLFEATVKASGQRLRAVLLTTITTVLGLLPTAYGLGGYDRFLVPMTLAFAWGLLFATVLTLGLVPMLYYLTEKMKLLVFGFLRGERGA